MELLLLLLLPLLIALGSFIWSVVRKDRRHIISLKEFLVIVGAVVLVMTLGYFISRYASTYDQEIWNGRVVAKKQISVSCEHSYSCNCRTVCSGSGKNQSCSTICDTCYEHSNDWNWMLFTNNQEEIKIARIDRRGSYEPPRFKSAKIGDPTALAHSYVNYIKANPWTILRREGSLEKFKAMISVYPLVIYDYHYIDRFLAIADNLPQKDIAAWNRDLMELNADLGRKKQVDIIFVVVPTTDSAYIHALEEAWLGGKKNDLVVIFGSAQYPKIDWVRTMSWTHAEELKIAIRDNLQDIGTLEKREEIIASVRSSVDKLFVRAQMKEFEYLMAGVRPPAWALILLLVLGSGLSVGLTIYFYQNDPFETGRNLW